MNYPMRPIYIALVIHSSNLYRDRDRIDNPVISLSCYYRYNTIVRAASGAKLTAGPVVSSISILFVGFVGQPTYRYDLR